MTRRKAEFSSDDPEAAREKCLRLLAVRARSTAELRERLRRVGFAPNVVGSVIADLTETGLVDDAEFARSWVASRQAAGGFGKQKLRWELRRKGVAEKLIETALEKAVSDETEEEQALLLAQKRLKGEVEDVRGLARVRRLLIGRGFGFDTVDRVMRRISSDGEHS
jgi:regulatory protein